jgi:hypothetical protein
MDKEASSLIVQVMEQNQFSKNFGPERIMSELHRCNIAEEWIPNQIQIQNKLSHHCQTGYPFLPEKKLQTNLLCFYMMWMIVIGYRSLMSTLSSSSLLLLIDFLLYIQLYNHILLSYLLSYFIFCFKTIFNFPIHFCTLYSASKPYSIFLFIFMSCTG